MNLNANEIYDCNPGNPFESNRLGSLGSIQGDFEQHLNVQSDSDDEFIFPQHNHEPANKSDTSSTLLIDSPSKLKDSYEILIKNDYCAGDETDQDRRKTLSLSDFQPIKVLGQGSFGKVFLVKQKSTGRLFAQKQMKKASIIVRKMGVKYTKTERQILEEVRHPFICKLYFALQDVDSLYLFLQYAAGGELFHYLANEKMLPESSVTFYTAELALALHHLHSLNIVYRDLKPENCLLDSEGHILLTDFGLSKREISHDETCKSFVGTAEYMAPETLEGKDYDHAVDWWALGILIYDLITGKPPFSARNNQKLIEKILKTKPNFPYYMSAEAKDIVVRLLRKNPSLRLGGKDTNDFESIKKHRFFRKIDWQALAERQVNPPMTPFITDPELAENFAAEFTSMPIDATNDYAQKDLAGLSYGQSFSGFTYIASPSAFYTFNETRLM